MRIVTVGYIVRGPLGGMCWHHLQYVLGLKQLGHEVLFMEDSEDYPCCYNPETYETTTDPSYGLQFIQDLFKRFELQHQWCYYDAHSNIWYGWSRQKVEFFCKNADLVINLSGVNPARDWWTSIPCRVLVDTDPAFTQIKNLTNANARKVAEEHSHYFTFGENYGKSFCKIPIDGFQWQPTKQPVCVDIWPVAEHKPYGNWTTLMQWDSYNASDFGGLFFGMKSQSFKDFRSLPQFIEGEKLELALGSTSAPRENLRKEGWVLSDPAIPSATPQNFQRFIGDSKGEWSIAKHGYVISNSGWFSERTLNYMASGKPVVVQDTGFSNFLPTGKGLFAFSSPEEAVAAIAEVNKNYEYHCKQARAFIKEHFESGKVLNSLLLNI